MNFLDIVTVKGPVPSKTTQAVVDALVRRSEDLRGWHRVRASRGSNDEAEGYAREMRTARLALYMKHGHLPKSLRESLWATYRSRFYNGAQGSVCDRVGFGEDYVAHVADAPKTTLKSLRDLASKFGFPIMPYEYVREDVRGPASAFCDQVGQLSGLGFHTYIMGPVNIYSIVDHMKSDVDLSVHTAGTMLHSALLTVPALRSLNRELGELRHSVQDAHVRIARVEQDVRGLQQQIDAMRSEIAQSRKEAAEAKASVREARLLAAMSPMSFSLQDPIAIAIPPGTQITDDGWGIIGPCWGPDFEEIVFASLGVGAIAGQRNRLEKQCSILSGRSR